MLLDMALVITLLLCVSVILLGAIAAKPVGWVVVALGVLALLLALLGGFDVRVGGGRSSVASPAGSVPV